ncbi:MAG: Uma2 family endonuclease, partial [Lachnospiraceae bacterium]|nr:Uma2 family endonuclease [Lachnospiraceae bacterium]
SENNCCNCFRQKPGNTIKIAINLQQLFVDNSLMSSAHSSCHRCSISDNGTALIKRCRNIFVICDKDRLTDEGCKGAPDWIIEVVSPSSHPMDYNKKLFKYRTVGVREYWIVDPMKPQRVGG